MIKKITDYSCKDLWATVQQFKHGRGKGDSKVITERKHNLELEEAEPFYKVCIFIYGKENVLSKDINPLRVFSDTQIILACSEER